MEALAIINLVSQLATLYVQEAPLLTEASTALQSGDQAQIDALLAKVQAANDVLGQA